MHDSVHHDSVPSSTAEETKRSALYIATGELYHYQMGEFK